MGLASGATNDVENQSAPARAIGNQRRACRVFAGAIFVIASVARPVMNGC
jgi:hypothetical protein